MSRYFPITSGSGTKSVITPGGYGEAAPITFSPGSKTKSSSNVRSGSDGTSASPGKMTGEY